MSDVDTRTEAVERLANGCKNYGRDWLVAYGPRLADTLRALLAERDAARAEVERLRQENAAYNDEHEIMV